MARRPVLELLASPTTTIASQLFEREAASSCRISVALHIVSNISQFVHTFFAISRHDSHNFCVPVVCETRQNGKSRRSGRSVSQFSSASAVWKTCASEEKLAMAMISGCVGVPMMRRLRPSRSAFCAITWIFLTNGHVASTIAAPRTASVFCSPAGMPCARMTTV